MTIEITDVVNHPQLIILWTLLLANVVLMLLFVVNMFGTGLKMRRRLMDKCGRNGSGIFLNPAAMARSMMSSDEFRAGMVKGFVLFAALIVDGIFIVLFCVFFLERQ